VLPSTGQASLGGAAKNEKCQFSGLCPRVRPHFFAPKTISWAPWNCLENVDAIIAAFSELYPTFSASALLMLKVPTKTFHKKVDAKYTRVPQSRYYLSAYLARSYTKVRLCSYLWEI